MMNVQRDREKEMMCDKRAYEWESFLKMCGAEMKCNEEKYIICVAIETFHKLG
jgi:hypothetical protein